MMRDLSGRWDCFEVQEAALWPLKPYQMQSVEEEDSGKEGEATFGYGLYCGNAGQVLDS